MGQNGRWGRSLTEPLLPVWLEGADDREVQRLEVAAHGASRIIGPRSFMEDASAPSTTPSDGGAPLAVLEYCVLRTQAAAFVVRPDREEPIVERLAVDGDTIRTATLRLVDETSPENINPVHPEWSSDFGFLEPLARALLDPVWPHLEGVDTICIVPHGHLFYLPFHALRLASGKYIIEDRPLVYAPSAALMMYARLHRKASKPSRFIGFGTGKVDDPPARRQGFEDEAIAISALPLWKERRRSQA